MEKPLKYQTRLGLGLCVYFMKGAPEGSTESGFMEKPGIKPATPSLQGIGLSPTPRRLLRAATIHVFLENQYNNDHITCNKIKYYLCQIR